MRYMIVCTGLAALMVAGTVRNAAAAEPETIPVSQVASKKGIGHKILMYIPNRLIDLVDIFRLRVRVGPGAAVHVRATEYLNGYAGTYSSVYVGLPGPRESTALRRFAGREQLKGLMMVGVDATDETPHHPGYSDSEFNLGLHVLLVGAEAGIDPVEIGDFFAGFLLFDPKGDDR